MNFINKTINLLQGPRVYLRNGGARGGGAGRAGWQEVRVRQREGRIYAHVRQELLWRERNRWRTGRLKMPDKSTTSFDMLDFKSYMKIYKR